MLLVGPLSAPHFTSKKSPSCLASQPRNVMCVHPLTYSAWLSIALGSCGLNYTNTMGLHHELDYPYNTHQRGAGPARFSPECSVWKKQAHYHDNSCKMCTFAKISFHESHTNKKLHVFVSAQQGQRVPNQHKPLFQNSTQPLWLLHTTRN